jgi:putative transcriptional regulator
MGGTDHEIRVTLDEVLEQRGMTLSELARRIGLTYANLSVLKNGHARAVRFSTLAMICRELDCQPGDLLRLTRS